MFWVIVHALACIQVPGISQVYRQLGEFYTWTIWQPIPQALSACTLH